MDARAYGRVWLPFLGGLVAIWALFRLGSAPYRLSQWFGLALALLGLAGATLARWTLGSSFSITPQARQLVTRGVYSKLRNPIYVFGTIFIAGLILIIGRPFLWIVLAASIVMQTLRARREAHVLEAKFGDDYRRYRDQTWF